MANERTVHYGIDESVPSEAKRPRKGNWAAKIYQEDNRGRHIWDVSEGTWLPLEYMAFEYDFDDQGGGIRPIDLGAIPAGTIIVDGVYDVIEALTSAGAAEITIGIEAADDVLAAEAVGTSGTYGLHDVDVTGAAATMIKVHDRQQLVMHPTVATLTAGRMMIYLRTLRGILEEAGSSESSSSGGASSSSNSSSSQSVSSSSSLSSSVAFSSSSSSSSIGVSSSSSSPDTSSSSNSSSSQGSSSQSSDSSISSQG